MRSRKKALLTVLGAVIIIFLMFAVFGYSRAWRVWNIPVMSLSFADLRVITHGADSVAQGLDPLVSNPGDPWGRPLNYPRIWQSLYSVGINKSHTIGLGVGFILMFLTGVVMILPNASNITISLIASALLSPAVLLAVERANIDLFIFFLVSLSVILARKSLFLPSGVIVFATALKLYPVFAISLLLKAGKKKFLWHALVVSAISLIYFVANWSEILLISQATPRSTVLSYGMNVVWMRIASSNPSLGLLARFISVALVLVAAFFVYVGCTQQSTLSTSDQGNGPYSLDSFRVGSCIYIGTFLLGNNWDYRLLFLILCIPQLSYWLTSSGKRLQWCSGLALCAMLASMWHLVILRVWEFLSPPLAQLMPSARLYPWLLDEFSNWLLFLVLIYLFSMSLPEWAKDLLLNPLRPTKRST